MFFNRGLLRGRGYNAPVTPRSYFFYKKCGVIFPNEFEIGLIVVTGKINVIGSFIQLSGRRALRG